MIRTEDYSSKVNTTVKYPFVMMKYMHDNSEKVTVFIKKSFSRIMTDAINHGDVAFISELCKSDKFFNKKNIDKFIDYANEKRQTEIQVILMNYKHDNIGFDDPLGDLKL